MTSIHHSPLRVALLFAGAAFLIRLLAFFTLEGDLRHGTAGFYGSVAIGLHEGKGLTFQPDEVQHVVDAPNNYGGDYLAFRSEGPRFLLTEFLPGPPVLISALWSLTGNHTFAPYLILQMLLDCVTIGLLYVVLVRYSRWLAVLVTLAVVLNPATMKRTLMVGYDFWPQLAVLALFLGTVQFLERRSGRGALWAAGMVGAAVAWCRDITSLLPFVMAGAVIAADVIGRQGTWNWRGSLRSAAALLVPVLVSLALLSLFRYETTGNPRPSRSTFWHTFTCGIGQFSNPYGLINNDESAWEFGKKLNPSLQSSTLDEEYRLPDSPYETTLKANALGFIRDHPGLFARNFLYRIGIMISPFLYRDGDLIPAALANRLFPLGVLMLPLWLLGMLDLFRRYRMLFVATAAIYAYFFLAFGWFYVAGRVICPFLFLSAAVYLLGCRFLWSRLRRKPHPLESPSFH